MTSRKGAGARQPPRKSVTAMALRAHIPRYSAMKKRAYLKPEYSVRWAAIISLSASGRSKGERLDSAKAATMKMKNPTAPQGVSMNQRGSKPHFQPDWAWTIPLVER